jgi:hypothetical protein
MWWCTGDTEHIRIAANFALRVRWQAYRQAAQYIQIAAQRFRQAHHQVKTPVTFKYLSGYFSA